MRRRKITPEVVIKSFGMFMIGAIVGFSAYHITGLVVNRTVFARANTEEHFPKTIEPVENHKQFINKFEKLRRPKESELNNFFR